MDLVQGVYETLISEAIKKRLEEKEKQGCFIAKEKIDSADSNSFFADYLAGVVSSVLKDVRMENPEEQITEQIERINQIFRFIQEEWQVDISDDVLAKETNFLRGIYNTMGLSKEQVKKKSEIHPSSGYRVSNLFTGSDREPSINEEMHRDILTSDNIDIMVSFILFTGLRLIIDELESFVKRSGTRLRIITTTYMGNSDPKALERLLQLNQYGNVEIKVSYNSGQERLHAKAYLFNRLNGLNTAYIGSSNLSKSAFTKGLEWNMRVTEIENRHIIGKAQAAFESYWNSENFEAVETEEDLKKFTAAIEKERKRAINKELEIPIITRFERKVHQIKVLEQLQYERKIINSYKNLIIAATGTGKTAISAFDFKDFNLQFKKENQRNARLLFVVHREQILKQARSTFRSVMVDANFGEIWTGNIHPDESGNLDHLFVTIQTINSNREFFRELGDKNFYDYVVIDEVHHSAAGSYRILFDLFHPKIFVGLTATPERMDGKSILPDFNDRYAAEIRLYDALNQQLLCPFQYFCVADDSVDFSHVSFRGSHYDIDELSSVLSSNFERVTVINNVLQRYVTDPQNVKAVCFCVSIAHAEFMAQKLNEYHYKAAALTSKSKDVQGDLLNKLSKGDLNYLCVVDMMNEGYDIPEIDTVLFLRPTDSLTVFLQQLGRGLRTADGKTELTVLDFVAQANQKYDYESRFRALTGCGRKETRDGIKNGFTQLPRGCSIEMEKVARERILETVKNSIFDLKRLRNEIAGFENISGKSLTLANFLDFYDLDIYTLYKGKSCWNALKRSAALLVDEPSNIQLHVEEKLYQLIHINDMDFLKWLKMIVESDFSLVVIVSRPEYDVKILYYDLFYEKLNALNKKLGTSFQSEKFAISALHGLSTLRAELLEMVDYISSKVNHVISSVGSDLPFNLYGSYSKDEINILFGGEISRGNMAGILNDEKRKIQVLFCTINKSDKEYSAETMYDDYAKNASVFHWQSQNSTRADSYTGRLYTEQKNNGWKFLLFMRDTKTNQYGFTNPYYCLGFIDFIDSTGECPMSINWQLQEPIPAMLLSKAMVV